MPINSDAESNISAVKRIHGALTDFKRFLQSIRDSTGGNVNAVMNIPSRVTNLLAQKADFDSIGMSAVRIEEIMTKDLGYSDWPLHISDFNSVFVKSAALRAVLINNIGSIAQSYNGDSYQLTVTAGVKIALETQLDDILGHFS